MAEKNKVKDTYPPKKEKKNTNICAFSDTKISSFQDCVNLKKSPKNLGGIFYQMDHIWWAPDRHQKSPGLKMRSQLSHTLCH